jgi:glutathionyl-hydroquinone reductase
VRTKLQLVSSQAHLDTVSEKSPALSPYGPVRAGLTTSQTTNDQVLTELLNSLENVVQNLNYKSFEVYDTLTVAIAEARAALSSGTTDTVGTDDNVRRVW